MNNSNSNVCSLEISHFPFSVMIIVIDYGIAQHLNIRFTVWGSGSAESHFQVLGGTHFIVFEFNA
jgi:hypothetical protein